MPSPNDPGPHELIKPGAGLSDLGTAVQDCRACERWRDATQAVSGEGAPDAPIAMVGEQPGDVEDRRGRPFVGPAGVLLRACMAEAGLTSDQVWMTNVMKHFGWRYEPGRGKRRIHRRPTVEQIHACHPWLDAELEVVRPQIVVCLGAVAAQTLIDRNFKVSVDRGEILPGPYGSMLATVHPSSLLRAPDEAQRRTSREGFVADLKVVAAHLKAVGKKATA